MKIKPWFSTEIEQDVEAVYHDNTSCLDGSNIEKNQHRYGTDNRRLCKQCARLDAAGR